MSTNTPTERLERYEKMTQEILRWLDAQDAPSAVPGENYTLARIQGLVEQVRAEAGVTEIRIPPTFNLKATRGQRGAYGFEATVNGAGSVEECMRLSQELITKAAAQLDNIGKLPGAQLARSLFTEPEENE